MIHFIGIVIMCLLLGGAFLHFSDALTGEDIVLVWLFFLAAHILGFRE